MINTFRRRTRSRFTAAAALIITSCTPCAFSTTGAELQTPQDDVADREFALAAPEITRITNLLVSERSNWLNGRTERLFPEVTALTSDSVKRPQLSDTHIPLHLRLIERARLVRIQGIKWAGAVPQCESPLFPPDKLVDAQFRQHALAVLQCHRERMNNDQIYWHRINALEEQTLWELNLPPATLERKIEEARATTKQTDIKEAQLFRRGIALYQSIEDLIIFIDVRASSAYIDNGKLRFRDPAVQKEFDKRFLK